MTGPGGLTAERDLVMVTVPGGSTIRWRGASTADVASASGIVSDLTAAMVAEVTASSEVVLPAGGLGVSASVSPGSWRCVRAVTGCQRKVMAS